MNVSLMPELEEFIRSKATGGLYGNASEVVRDALRGLIAHRRTANPEPPTPPDKGDVRAVTAGMEQEFREMGVTSLGILGSVARDEQGPGSDVDVAIEYDPDSGFGLFTLMSRSAGSRTGWGVPWTWSPATAWWRFAGKKPSGASRGSFDSLRIQGNAQDWPMRRRHSQAARCQPPFA